jgi:tetratricopeptide (TPR) repeat protein
VPALRFFADGPEAAEEVDRFLAVSDRANPVAGAVVPYAEVLLDEGDGKAVAALNMARDVLGKLIRGPLVLVLPAARAGELARAASDLWDVRAGTVVVEAKVVETKLPEREEEPQLRADTPRRTRAEMLADAARLRALADVEEVPAGAVVDAWVRLGWELLGANEPGEARQAAEEAARIAERSRYEGGLGDALYLRAQVLEQAGYVEEWLGALRAALSRHEAAGRRQATATDRYQLGRALTRAGKLEEAEQTCRTALSDFEALGDVRSRAITMAQIADILQERGQLDEALRIQREELLPIFKLLGEERERAISLSKIAGILQARGQLDEALRIFREELLPIFERLGNVRDRAVTMGRIANVLLERGQLDEALRIRREEELPIYELLGDVHARAGTMGQIAYILQERGQLDEALRIVVQEEIPVYERLGDLRGLAVARGNLAIILLARDAPGDRAEAAHLLQLAHTAAVALGVPEADQIRDIQQHYDLPLTPSNPTP